MRTKMTGHGALPALAVALVLALAAHVGAQPALFVYDFALDASPAENVVTVDALGYSGLVTRVRDPADVDKLADYALHVATLDDFALLAYVVYDFSDPDSPDVWRDALPILAFTGAPLWVVVRKAPSDAAVRDLLADMARESEAFGIRAVIYPHWDTSIETAAEAAAHIDAVGHPNLKNSLHTYHEIRGGNQYDLRDVVYDHADQIELVGIAGADEDAYAGPPTLFVTWDDVIKPLDEGDFDLLPFLQALHDVRYDGPVILQTFDITEPPDHLERSLRKYAQYDAHVVRRGR